MIILFEIDGVNSLNFERLNASFLKEKIGGSFKNEYNHIFIRAFQTTVNIVDSADLLTRNFNPFSVRLDKNVLFLKNLTLVSL
jgi:hypothetical protein